jgi:hypothetical protein
MPGTVLSFPPAATADVEARVGRQGSRADEAKAVMITMNQHIADVDFTDGVRRPVMQEPSGRQYVEDADGDRVYGVWYMPRGQTDEDLRGPDLIVDELPF